MAVRVILAKHFTDKVKLLKDMGKKSSTKLFPDMEEKREFLLNYTGAISENNYIDRANDFLSNKTVFVDHIRAIEKVEKFIKNNLPKGKGLEIICIGCGGRVE